MTYLVDPEPNDLIEFGKPDEISLFSSLSSRTGKTKQNKTMKRVLSTIEGMVPNVSSYESKEVNKARVNKASKFNNGVLGCSAAVQRLNLV